MGRGEPQEACPQGSAGLPSGPDTFLGTQCWGRHWPQQALRTGTWDCSPGCQRGQGRWGRMRKSTLGSFLGLGVASPSRPLRRHQTDCKMRTQIREARKPAQGHTACSGQDPKVGPQERDPFCIHHSRYESIAQHPTPPAGPSPSPRWDLLAPPQGAQAGAADTWIPRVPVDAGRALPSPGPLQRSPLCWLLLGSPLKAPTVAPGLSLPTTKVFKVVLSATPCS